MQPRGVKKRRGLEDEEEEKEDIYREMKRKEV